MRISLIMIVLLLSTSIYGSMIPEKVLDQLSAKCKKKVLLIDKQKKMFTPFYIEDLYKECKNNSHYMKSRYVETMALVNFQKAENGDCSGMDGASIRAYLMNLIDKTLEKNRPKSAAGSKESLQPIKPLPPISATVEYANCKNMLYQLADAESMFETYSKIRDEFKAYEKKEKEKLIQMRMELMPLSLQLSACRDLGGKGKVGKYDCKALIKKEEQLMKASMALNEYTADYMMKSEKLLEAITIKKNSLNRFYFGGQKEACENLLGIGSGGTIENHQGSGIQTQTK